MARTANALDPTSRTLLVEVNVPNSGGELLPGMSVQVDLSALARERAAGHSGGCAGDPVERFRGRSGSSLTVPSTSRKSRLGAITETVLRFSTGSMKGTPSFKIRAMWFARE